MKRTFVRMSVLTVIAMTMAPAAARADKDCKPVVGSFEAHVVTDGCESPVGLCTAGRVWGGLQGTYQFVMSSLMPSGRPAVAPTILFFTGDSTVTLKTGDVVRGEDTGAIDLPPGEGGFASLITFNGGTGAAEHATGQIRLRGELDPAAGTTSGDYLGTICSTH